MHVFFNLWVKEGIIRFIFSFALQNSLHYLETLALFFFYYFKADTIFHSSVCLSLAFSVYQPVCVCDSLCVCSTCLHFSPNLRLGLPLFSGASWPSFCRAAMWISLQQPIKNIYYFFRWMQSCMLSEERKRLMVVRSNFPS